LLNIPHTNRRKLRKVSRRTYGRGSFSIASFSRVLTLFLFRKKVTAEIGKLTSDFVSHNYANNIFFLLSVWVKVASYETVRLDLHIVEFVKLTFYYPFIKVFEI
jgi:hypothetical protein